MKRGCVASSTSAFRSSWMHDVSAASLTAVSVHTEASNSSLDTRVPARVTSTLRTAQASGDSRTSRLPVHSRLPARSKRYFPNSTPCSATARALLAAGPTSSDSPFVTLLRRRQWAPSLEQTPALLPIWVGAGPSPGGACPSPNGDCATDD